MRIISQMMLSMFLAGNLMASTQEISIAWEGFSSPDIISSGFTHNIYSLPTEGATYWGGPKYWSGPYWANKLGGINFRWNSRKQESFNYSSPTFEKLKRMSLQEKMALAPTEKFDILSGRYDYPLKNEVAGKVSPSAQDWEGICHGWVLASLHHSEPTPKSFKNQDGIVIPFGSSDIKALLSYYYAESLKPADQVGLRCNFGDWTGGAKECDQDLNAGAFHIIMANKLALQNDGFVMDIERFAEVWNQPIVAYRSFYLSRHYPSRTAARGTSYELRVQTEVYYINETEAFWNVVHGTQEQKMAVKVFTYRLELNSRNEIIGGEWESEERPDFIWQKHKETQFAGLFELMPYLLND